MRNDKLLDSDLNKTFEEILSMTDDEFHQWCIDIRKLVVKLWDEEGLPPIVGYTEDEIAQAFNELEPYPVFKFETLDEYTNEKNVIRNTSNYSGYVNSWFPTMMKTKINYTHDSNGKSVYDFFAKDELLDTFCTYARRHFRRDSFYAFSNPLRVRDTRYIDVLPVSDDALDWITQFERNPRENWDWWFCPVKEEKEYSGYNEKLQGKKYLEMTYDETFTSTDFKDKIWEQKHFGNVKKDHDLYQIRVYQKGQKIFPIGLKFWKVSFCQYAVNFPPLTAKYLYEKYTKEIKDDKIKIYDPSMGWAGRLIGAMSYRGKHVHYIGTDPNTDHNVGNGRTKYHEVADFYRKVVPKDDNFYDPQPHTDTTFFQLGSEEIRKNPDFQKFKGQIDIVFTSPPYFNREGYSQDDAQSFKKFPGYEDWREGFLRPTLTTAVEWLKPNRYLLWNISDIKIGDEFVPLEKDSNDILTSLGMKFITVEKMALAQMPGGNRVDPETGLPKAKNFSRVNGIWLRYEPVFVWKKE